MLLHSTKSRSFT